MRALVLFYKKSIWLDLDKKFLWNTLDGLGWLVSRVQSHCNNVDKKLVIWSHSKHILIGKFKTFFKIQWAVNRNYFKQKLQRNSILYKLTLVIRKFEKHHFIWGFIISDIDLCAHISLVVLYVMLLFALFKNTFLQKLTLDNIWSYLF